MSRQLRCIGLVYGKLFCVRWRQRISQGVVDEFQAFYNNKQSNVGPVLVAYGEPMLCRR